jgi:hypothetical protein
MQTIEIIEKCKVEGNSVRLPEIQLQRNEYCELEKILIKAGAKKIRGKDFRFDFPTDAQPIIDQLCGGKKIDIKKEFQFFETPKELAKQMIELAEICENDFVLEPSAGQGAIVDLFPKNFESVILYELNPVNQKVLQSKGYQLAGDDFLKCEHKNFFTKIIANPPFSKNQDIDHVLKMYEVLQEGGRIITIMSNHWKNSDNKKETEFRNWLETVDYTIETIPANTFKESGTSIAACLLIINK